MTSTNSSQCAESDPSLAPLAAQARSLTAYASRFRCPGAPYKPSREELAAAHSLAREVYEAILRRVPDAARP